MVILTILSVTRKSVKGKKVMYSRTVGIVAGGLKQGHAVADGSGRLVILRFNKQEIEIE